MWIHRAPVVNKHSPINEVFWRKAAVEVGERDHRGAIRELYRRAPTRTAVRRGVPAITVAIQAWLQTMFAAHCAGSIRITCTDGLGTHVQLAVAQDAAIGTAVCSALACRLGGQARAVRMLIAPP